MTLMRLRRTLLLTLVVSFGGAALLVGCGDDEDDGSSSAGDPARFCQLSRQLDQAGTDFFAELEQQGGSAKQFEAAERRFYQRYQEEFDQVAAAAPEELSEDIETLFAGVRARAGLGPPVPQDEVSAAERRVQAYEKTNC
jgi:hypothetical protein